MVQGTRSVEDGRSGSAASPPSADGGASNGHVAVRLTDVHASMSATALACPLAAGNEEPEGQPRRQPREG